jgi:hypothetical protein
VGVYVNVSVEFGDIDEAYENAKLLPLLEGHKTEPFSLVVDGMCGRYMYLGIKLFELEDLERGCFEVMDISDIEDSKKRVEAKCAELGFDIKERPELICFTHCY